MTINNEDYFNYLKGRSILGYLYRKFYLYPLVSKYCIGKVLDVGCGIGDYLNFDKNSIGVDVNPLLVEFCLKRKLTAYSMNIDNLPFDDASFDTVMLDNVIEHIDDPQNLIDEIVRVLMPNGVLIIGVPGIKGWNADQDHKIFYNEKILSNFISDTFIHKKMKYFPFIKSDYLSKTLKNYTIFSIYTKK